MLHFVEQRGIHRAAASLKHDQDLALKGMRPMFTVSAP
jgi:hypothetical protein